MIGRQPSYDCRERWTNGQAVFTVCDRRRAPARATKGTGLAVRSNDRSTRVLYRSTRTCLLMGTGEGNTQLLFYRLEWRPRRRIGGRLRDSRVCTSTVHRPFREENPDLMTAGDDRSRSFRRDNTSRKGPNKRRRTSNSF